MSNALKHRAGKGLLWRLAFYGSLAGLILYAQPAARCFFDPLREDSLLQPCLTTSSMVLLPEKQRASALFQVAQSHASSGLPTEAIATAEHAVALDPSLRGGREFLAEIFYRAGNAALDLKSFSAAIENYTKALEHDPSHRRARMRRGFAFSEAGQLATSPKS
jgi:tetratricopeptide (TPR) repeat protein